MSTLVDLLQQRAETHGHKTVYTFLSSRGVVQDEISFARLDARAQAIAAHLQQRGAAGSRALLLCPPGISFISAYFGCLYAGVTAVPCYPPGLARASTAALQAISADSQADYVLTIGTWCRDTKLTDLVQRRRTTAPTWIAIDQIDDDRAAAWRPPTIDADSIAFLQYTSGSTGDPKGVMVSHGNLLANLALIEKGFSLTSGELGVFWLPPYHDMGLIGAILAPLYSGFTAILMAPATFLRKPLLWLDVLSRYGGTVGGGPNFAFEMCVRALAKSKQAPDLDLSRWQIAFTGAEMVRVETMARFEAAFAPFGFDGRAITPCYGLAEATLLAAVSPRDVCPSRLDVNRQAIEKDVLSPDAIRSTSRPGWARTWSITGCGCPPRGARVEVVDPESRTICSEDRVGEVWIHGPSVAKGYWGRPELSAEVFGARLASEDEATFLRTGDRGFVHDGELFLTGRIKDLIIVRGRNYSAEDIEDSVRACHEAIKPSRCLAFSIDRGDHEAVLVSVECDVKKMPRRSDTVGRSRVEEEIRTAVTQAVLENHGLEIDAVIFQKPGGTPMTTSGKLQRAACRARCLEALADLEREARGLEALSYSAAFGGATLANNNLSTTA